MKKILFLITVIAMTMNLNAQNTWSRFDKLMDDGSYKSAFELAEGVYKNSSVSAERLAAAYHMSLAAARYQEDARDSAESRYRELLPSLAPLEQALCLAFLGEYDSALERHAELLKQTSVEDIKDYCEGYKTFNVTPTAYDVIVMEAQDVCTPQRRVELQQALVDFHRDASDDIRLFHENRLLNLLANVPNQPLTVERIQASMKKFRGTQSPWYTLMYSRLAQYYANREEYVTALQYCDSAIRMDSKSEGGVACGNLRRDILQKRVSMEQDGLWVMPGQASLQRVRYRNLDHLYYRIIRHLESFSYGEENKKRLLAEKAVTSGEWRVENGKDYHYAESYVSLPALKSGQYLLLVSPSADFKDDGFMVYEIDCTEMLLLQNAQEGMLLDRRSGRPIAGQKLTIERSMYNAPNKVLATAVTDADGRYHFDYKDTRWNDKIVVERDGYRLTSSYNHSNNSVDTTMYLQTEVRIDRPIYKPGDTVQAAILCYRGNGREATVVVGEKLQVLFYDPNSEEVGAVDVTTDDFGIASVAFAIPTDRLAGIYELTIKHDALSISSTSVRVEEYKQPKFMVSLDTESGEAPQFGKPYTVHGLAASYSAVPVSGARVQYTVVRRQLHRWWWRWWGIENETQVAEGELTAAADGTFSLVFTPEPDSSVELSNKPTFEYEVRVDVTDLNGESHPAATSLRVGYCNAFVSLDEGSTPDNLIINHFDINGNPLPGKVQSKIELLRQPVVPLLDSPILAEGVQHTMTEAEWRKAFPLIAYGTEYNDPKEWSVESEGWRMKSGVYRVTLSAEGAETVTEYLTYVAPDARRVPIQKLLWAEFDKRQAEVGETVRLRMGSRFRDVEVYYLLRIGNQEREFRRIILSDEIKTVDIPVDSTMLGGFEVTLIAVREGVEERWQHSVDVPFSHKRMTVDITTFRDKLLPGEQEEWTIRVESGERKAESAALMMTMYDDALNSYGSSQMWDFSPWRHNWSRRFTPVHISGSRGDWIVTYTRLYYSGTTPSVWSLKDALPRYNPWSSRRVLYRAASKNGAIPEPMMLSVVEDGMVEEEAAVMDAAAPMEAETQATGTEAGGEEVQLRTNLNTLAFFAPSLRTDADGKVTYRFTVPELLTRWNVRGLAVTRDIKTGTVDRTLVTQKPLMVQPNMPRFLRSGDSLALMAKVVLGEDLRKKDESMPVEVSFLLTDAATGETLCHHTEHVTVKDVAQVSFPVEVPQNVYVATYRIVASGRCQEGSYSDGEQGQMPVVTNRQAVTVSQALYINGAGEKHFSMPEWLVTSDTREPHLVGAEVTSNPVWLAVKCMPYLKTMENPSTLYLAYQLYVNSMGRSIIENPDLDIATLLKEDYASQSTHRSPLAMNEDVKQTLLKATPWVRDADSEEEQMRAVAAYFDSEALGAELRSLTSQLVERQNADGGWSWMPEGQSSLWITQQVLRDVVPCAASLSQNTKQALAFVDREQQQYYLRWIKPYIKKGYGWEPTDIDYLYTRSFYGKATTEAYRFYYTNALKHYRDCENLYTQAQLALIFFRNGDKKQALDLLRRLKEKSLTNDEMGMYWRDNVSGWFWYQRPVETQALLIQAFSEITPDDRETIGLMQQWLLKQKQTTHWGNDAATTSAISALMCGSSRPTAPTRPVGLNVFGTEMTAEAQGLEGYRSQRWSGADLDSLRAIRSSDIVVSKADEGIAWGAVYYQFTDNMDRIPVTNMGITVKRTYQMPDELHVGDRIKVRIDITCDRAMEYLELIDGRPSCVEPLSTRAGWRWNEGLSYYITVNGTDTRCYIERLDKGKYWFEYEVYVTNPGTFLTGPVTMQCMYAPEFRATAPARELRVMN